MILFRAAICAVVVLGLLPHEPNLGLGRPGMDAPQSIEAVRELVIERLHQVKADLAANARDAKASHPVTIADLLARE